MLPINFIWVFSLRLPTLSRLGCPKSCIPEYCLEFFTEFIRAIYSQWVGPKPQANFKYPWKGVETSIPRCKMKTRRSSTSYFSGPGKVHRETELEHKINSSPITHVEWGREKLYRDHSTIGKGAKKPWYQKETYNRVCEEGVVDDRSTRIPLDTISRTSFQQGHYGVCYHTGPVGLLCLSIFP